MWIPLKAIIGKKPRKDGNSPIYFQYCYSSTNRTLLNTEIAIPKQYWNSKRQCISKLLPGEIADFEILNSEVSRIKKIIEKIIEYGTSINTPNIGVYVKNTFDPHFDVDTLKTTQEPIQIYKKEPDFFAEIDSFMNAKKTTITEYTLATFRIMKQRLVAFEAYRNKKITFGCLDYNFYSELMDFLTYYYVQSRKREVIYGLKASTIGRTVKQLRIFIRDRVRRKVISPIDMEDFKVIDEEADAIYLSYEEIGKIYSLDLADDQTLELYRDMFVFGSLTGLRFSDYSSLQWEDLRNGLLYKKAKKVDAWVIIPLRKEAIEIFTKHYSKGTPKISNPVFNKYIKVIAEKAGITKLITFSYKKGTKNIIETKPKSKWVTSHTCRRSFCTNEYLAGTEISLIMKISGHKTHKDFFKYIRVTQEEAARQIQEIWVARNNMSAFSLTKTG